MAGLPFLKFYPADWLSDPLLARCSPATRGIFMDALAIMHELNSPTIKATPDELCRSLRCSPAELDFAVAQLRDTGTADVLRDLSTISITSRRMKRDMRKSKLCSAAGRAGGGNPSLQTSKGQPKGVVKHTPKHPSVICNLSSDLLISLPSPEGGAGETTGPIDRQRNSPLVIRDIWMAYPEDGRTSFQKARLEIDAALTLIAERGEKNAAAWLLGRVRAFAVSQAGKSGGYTKYAPNWFSEGKYDDAPAAWERAAPSIAPEPAMTAAKLDQLLSAKP